jgi:hypothetical protein
VKRESFLDQQNGRSSDEQVGAEIRFDFDEPVHHPLQHNCPMTDVRLDMDVIEPAPLGADAQAGESLAVRFHRSDRGHFEDGQMTD